MNNMTPSKFENKFREKKEDDDGHFLIGSTYKIA